MNLSTKALGYIAGAIILALASCSALFAFKWMYAKEEIAALSIQVSTEQLAVATCAGNYKGLEIQLTAVKTQIDGMKEENLALRDAIALSSESISRISTATINRINSIKAQTAGSTCEERFQWLRDKAGEIR